jgi:GNAT superfamily N-acetyltransferase
MAGHLLFALDPELTPALREEIIALWADVANAGGAVGFAGPVTRAEVRAFAAPALRAVREGTDHLLLGYADGRLAAMLLFVSQRFALSEHWRTVKRVMVHPSLQGNGFGAALIRQAETVARRMGWEALHVTVREGTGVEKFYAAHGYREVGRLPGALRIAPGDDRDETHMWLRIGVAGPGTSSGRPR